MTSFSRTALTFVLLAAATPAVAHAAPVKLAAVRPADSSAPELQPDAVLLSVEAQAVKDALDRASGTADGRDKASLAALAALYEKRGYVPLWVQGGRASRQMSGLRRVMDGAARDGLDPDSYRTPGFAVDYPADIATQASAEIEFSRVAARFVTELASGRFAPTRISPLITLEPERPDVADTLKKLSTTAGVALAVSRYEPPQPDYAALKRKLAELRADRAATARITVPEGKALKPGTRDPRVPILRARLELETAPNTDAEIYDGALAAAVRAFQTESKLAPDAVIGPRTLALLNGADPAADIASIVVNMERWRWMPRELGAFHIFVNVPAFDVDVVRDGETVDEHRVVVGAPDHPTPTFSNRMSHLVVNPYWNVPVSIVSREMLPAIQRDPSGYFARKGYQVLARAGGKMQVVDPDSIDWWGLNPRAVSIRQVPGDDNALGRIKFMFPNQHAVYLHDTPSKALFRKDFRAYSHGCVRVDDPLGFADTILAVAAPKWNGRRIEKLFGGKERRISLDQPIPIHLGYFTFTIDPAGTVHRYGDVYGYDAKMRALIAS